LQSYGGSPYEQQERDLRRGVDIVVGTPGRIIDFLNKKTLRLDTCRFLVLDEAGLCERSCYLKFAQIFVFQDEMLNMGFADDVESIIGFLPKEGVQKV
jgi:ATP-dependent RNA helicase DeaD